jgi:hypothetical protein
MVISNKAQMMLNLKKFNMMMNLIGASVDFTTSCDASPRY